MARQRIGAFVVGGADKGMEVQGDGQGWVMNPGTHAPIVPCNAGNLDLSRFAWVSRVLNGSNGALVITPGSAIEGQVFNVVLIQDGTGSRLVSSYFTGYTVRWPGGAAPTLSTAANAVDVLTFKVVSATEIWGFVVGQGIA